MWMILECIEVGAKKDRGIIGKSALNLYKKLKKCIDIHNQAWYDNNIQKNVVCRKLIKLLDWQMLRKEENI